MAPHRTLLLFVPLLMMLASQDIVFGWHDETHLAVAQAAGYRKWYNAAGADMAKLKAGPAEQYNHYFNNVRDRDITPEFVMEQTARYNDPADPEGHLYGAIIASLREYRSTAREGKYPEYHIAFCAHYAGDLSQPFHNIPYDDFNKARHAVNDGIVEHEVRDNIARIRGAMYAVQLREKHFEEDLAREIARIATIAWKLGARLREEDRDLTKEEAYLQLGHSASLLKAILDALGKETD